MSAPLRRSARIAAYHAARLAAKREDSMKKECRCCWEEKSDTEHWDLLVERERIDAQIGVCDCLICKIRKENNNQHEANCAFCYSHPEWRLWSHNFVAMSQALKDVKGDDAKELIAIATLYYLMDHIEWLLAHEPMKEALSLRCAHFMSEAKSEHLHQLSKEMMEKLSK